LDFGIAKLKEGHIEDSKLDHFTLTGAGMVIGTPAYMSPEQAKGAQGDQLDGRSDIYSLAVVMYEMLCGDLPLKADSEIGLVMAHIQKQPPPIRSLRPEIPERIAKLVMRCLEKKTGLRFATGRALVEEIERWEEVQALAHVRPEKQRLTDRGTEAERTAPEKAERELLLQEMAGAMVRIRAERVQLDHHRAEAERTKRAAWEQAEQERRERRPTDLKVCASRGQDQASQTLKNKAEQACPVREKADRDRQAMVRVNPERGEAPVQSILSQARTHSVAPGISRKLWLWVAAAAAVLGPGIWYLSSRSERTAKPSRETVTVKSWDGLKYAWIPPATFEMGCSTEDNECFKDEKPAHQVTITKGFWLEQTPLTVGAYKRFARETTRAMPPEPKLGSNALNPGWGNEQMPIVNVTWGDSQAYCKWVGGRLPTEAEWEYAARAGSKEARYGSLEDVAWYEGNSGRERIESTKIWSEDQSHYFDHQPERLAANGNKMQAVGLKRPNDWRLYDMLGNVREWVSDWYGETYYQSGSERDPQGPDYGTLRVLRGGSWDSVPGYIRVSDRYSGYPDSRYIDGGCRCLREGGAP
jgi:formylglycine-generating enzyme required for sulfatase activity